MLSKLISERRDHIHKQWVDMIVASYPENTSAFLKNQKNQFANPVGYTINEMTAAVLDVLTGQKTAREVYELIDRFVRIRAVQDLLHLQQLISFLCSNM